jgi:subtilisin family serine protease
MTRSAAHPGPALGSRLLAVLAALTLLLAAAPAAAVVSDEPREADASGRYIILFDDPPLAAYDGGIDGLAPTNPEVTGGPRLDVDSVASQAYLAHLAAQRDVRLASMEAALGRPVEAIFSYDVTLNGVAVELSDGEAATVASLGGIARVAPDETRFLQTDNGPEWIGAPAVWDGSATGGRPATSGEGVVAGIIDTGVNFDHPSFAATGDDGFTHTNPRGQFFGLCDPVAGQPFCNDKLIGVYDFTGSGPLDTNGHGSHTASTTAGNVVDASLVAPTITVDRRISGVAPHANLITYKVCPDLSCLLTAILAAINQAATDEVDVINYGRFDGRLPGRRTMAAERWRQHPRP